MIKGVIFDCFGVIVGRGFDNTYRSAGGDPIRDREFIEDMLGRANIGAISDDDFRKQMAAKLGLKASKWRQTVVDAEQADQALLGYVKELRSRYKTAILSNANLGVVERKIGDNLLKDCFDEVIVSAEIGMVKPEPRIYHYAADKLGLKPSECLFIDDSEEHVRAAIATGMHGIIYRGLTNLKTDAAAIFKQS